MGFSKHQNFPLIRVRTGGGGESRTAAGVGREVGEGRFNDGAKILRRPVGRRWSVVSHIRFASFVAFSAWSEQSDAIKFRFSVSSR